MSSRDQGPPPALLDEHQAIRSFFQWAWFEFRAAGLRVLRSVRDWREETSSPAKIDTAEATEWSQVLGESISPLWTATTPTEIKLIAGKVQNLRVAAVRLDGLMVADGEVFRFWKAVGPPRRRRGFVEGRELREGCMVATVGGGLCQLSNALHLAALEAGMEITERHAHSKVVPGSIAATGKDATVFWNYKDLRFRASTSFVVQAQLSATHLIVRLRAREAVRPESKPVNIGNSPALEEAEDCVTCHHHACVYHPGAATGTERTALLLDECWPEFETWLAGENLTERDIALLPLDGVRRKRSAYAWLKGEEHRPTIREHPWLVLQRSWKSRRLKAQGAARQKALLAFDGELARSYARHLPYDCQRVVVSLNLLPHLAGSGVLGGRHVAVFLNRSPLFLLHRQLDLAARLYPESETIGDFRADDSLVESERAALARADLLVTPHVWVAEQLRREGLNRVKLLSWAEGQQRPYQPGKRILFPASSLARKGAYEVREMCRELGLPLSVMGRAMESEHFWEGIQVDYVQSGPALFCDVACVVLPAHVEHQPRILLSAIRSGVPVVCSTNCGLPAGIPSVALVTPGDVEALRSRVEICVENSIGSCLPTT